LDKGFNVKLDGKQIIEINTSNLIFKMVGTEQIQSTAMANLTVAPTEPKLEQPTQFETWHR
jgi:hypothetical protein